MRWLDDRNSRTRSSEPSRPHAWHRCPPLPRSHGFLPTNAYPAGADAIFLIALGPAIQQIGELARAVLIARGRIFVASAHSMVENIAWLAAVVGGFGAGMDVIPTFLLAGVVLVLVDVAAYAMLAIVLRTGVARPSRGELRELMGQAGPFVGFSTLTFLASRSDTLLIGLLLPNGLAIGGAELRRRQARRSSRIRAGFGRSGDLP